MFGIIIVLGGRGVGELWRKIIFTIVPCILKLSKFFSLTDAQENCFKRSIKIYIKTAPTCFGVIAIIRERTI
jgi:hypothetical protein